MPDGDSAFAGHAADAPVAGLGRVARARRRATNGARRRQCVARAASPPCRCTTRPRRMRPPTSGRPSTAARTRSSDTPPPRPCRLSATSTRRPPSGTPYPTPRSRRPGSSRIAPVHVSATSQRARPPSGTCARRREHVRRTELRRARARLRGVARVVAERHTVPAGERSADTRSTRRCSARPRRRARRRRGRPIDVGAKAVGRTHGRRCRAALGGVADAVRRSAHRRVRHEGVRRTRGGRARAALGDVAYAGRRAAQHARGDERVRRTGRRRARAEPATSHAPAVERHTAPEVAIASAGQLADEPVQRLGDVARPAAERHTAVLGWNAFAGHVIAAPLHVSETSHTPAAERQIVLRRRRRVGRAGRGRAAARLDRVARAGGQSDTACALGANPFAGHAAATPVHVSATSHTPLADAADGRGGQERVGRTGSRTSRCKSRRRRTARPSGDRPTSSARTSRRDKSVESAGAVLGDVARTGGRPADREDARQHVGGTSSTCPCTSRRRRTGPARRPADGGGRRQRIGRTSGRAARAGLGRVADPGGRSADGRRRRERIRGTVRRRARARLRDVAHAHGRPARRRRRLERAPGRAAHAPGDRGIAVLARIEHAVVADRAGRRRGRQAQHEDEPQQRDSTRPPAIPAAMA